MMKITRVVNLFVLAAVFILCGCTPSSIEGLSDVIKPPFNIQYPARSDIVPGDIWVTEGDTLASPMFDSQEAIPKREADGGFTKIAEKTIIVADAEADLAPLAQGSIKDLKAELEARDIKTLTVEGKYKIRGVKGLGYVVRPEILARCDDDYVLTLRELTENAKSRATFVTQVVTVEDFKYVATVNDAFTIEGDLKATGVVAGAGFTATNEQTLTWEMPSGQAMVVAWMTEALPPLPDGPIIDAQRKKQAEIKKELQTEFERRLAALEQQIVISGDKTVIGGFVEFDRADGTVIVRNVDNKPGYVMLRVPSNYGWFGVPFSGGLIELADGSSNQNILLRLGVQDLHPDDARSDWRGSIMSADWNTNSETHRPWRWPIPFGQ
jgi:hypothetical protein